MRGPVRIACPASGQFNSKPALVRRCRGMPFLDSVSLAPPCAKLYTPKEFDSCGTWAHAARLVELESTPLDHSGKLSCCCYAFEKRRSMRALPSLFSASGQFSSRLRSSTSLEARFPAAARNIKTCRVSCSFERACEFARACCGAPFPASTRQNKSCRPNPFLFLQPCCSNGWSATS